MRKLRFTIGGLMAVVLVAAIDVAAVRSASPTWAGVLSLLTYGTLGVAILGIVFRRGAERAWWIGSFVFGWGYLRLAPWSFSHLAKPPTLLLLEWLRTKSGAPPTAPDPFSTENLVLLQIDRCLWALPAALLGGLLARAFFASAPVGTEHPEPAAHQAARPLWKLAIPPVLIGIAVLVLVRSVAAILWTSDAGLWAGGTYLLSCGLLGIATLGAILGRGKRREIGIGASLFGAGYFYMAMVPNAYPFNDPRFVPRVTDQFLNAIRPLLPAASGGLTPANARVLKVLERPIPMRFPAATALGDILNHIKKATATPGQPDILIYVDPLGLQEAARSLSSTVQIDIDGVPLKTTLALCLRQLGLDYIVKDGVLRISSEEDEIEPAGDDSFRIVGHSLLALIAATIGGVLAPLVSAVSRDRPGPGGSENAPASARAFEQRDRRENEP